MAISFVYHPITSTDNIQPRVVFSVIMNSEISNIRPLSIQFSLYVKEF